MLLCKRFIQSVFILYTLHSYYKLESLVCQLNKGQGLPKSNLFCLFCGIGAHAFAERLESSEDVDEAERLGWPGAFCCRCFVYPMSRPCGVVDTVDGQNPAADGDFSMQDPTNQTCF